LTNYSEISQSIKLIWYIYLTNAYGKAKKEIDQTSLDRLLFDNYVKCIQM